MVKGMLRVVVAGVGAVMMVACSTNGGSRTVTFDTGAQIKQLELRPMTARQEFNALSSRMAEPALMIKPMSSVSDAEPVSSKASDIVSVSIQESARAAAGAGHHCPGSAAFDSLDD